MKSHRIWPIWKLIPIRFFKSRRIFSPSYSTFYEEIIIHHTLLYLSQASYIKIEAFDYWAGGGGSLNVIFVKISQNFIKSPIKNCLISQISVFSLWNVWKMELKRLFRIQVVQSIRSLSVIST